MTIDICLLLFCSVFYLTHYFRSGPRLPPSPPSTPSRWRWWSVGTSSCSRRPGTPSSLRILRIQYLINEQKGLLFNQNQFLIIYIFFSFGNSLIQGVKFEHNVYFIHFSQFKHQWMNGHAALFSLRFHFMLETRNREKEKKNCL